MKLQYITIVFRTVLTKPCSSAQFAAGVGGGGGYRKWVKETPIKYVHLVDVRCVRMTIFANLKHRITRMMHTTAGMATAAAILTRQRENLYLELIPTTRHLLICYMYIINCANNCIMMMRVHIQFFSGIVQVNWN